MATKSKLSAVEYITFAAAVLKTVCAVIWAVVNGITRGTPGTLSVKRHVSHTAIRTMMHNATVRHFQAISPSTRQAYTDFVKKNGFPMIQADLGDETFGFWLGSKKAKTVMLYLHGGGYATTASEEYFQMLANLVKAATNKGLELAIFVLEYTMAPAGQYPHQLKQATSALRHLVEVEGRNPSSILLGGDSAGGNLALALLSHLSHPQGKIPPLKLETPLRGAILLSPWVTFEQDSKSMETKRNIDVLDVDALKAWSKSYQGSADIDCYLDARLAPSIWWRKLQADDICLTAGQDELFVDDIEQVGQMIKAENGNVEIFIAQGEAHDEAYFGYVFQDRPEGGGLSEQFFREWVLKRCH